MVFANSCQTFIGFVYPSRCIRLKSFKITDSSKCCGYLIVFNQYPFITRCRIIISKSVSVTIRIRYCINHITNITDMLRFKVVCIPRTSGIITKKGNRIGGPSFNLCINSIVKIFYCIIDFRIEIRNIILMLFESIFNRFTSYSDTINFTNFNIFSFKICNINGICINRSSC